MGGWGEQLQGVQGELDALAKLPLKDMDSRVTEAKLPTTKREVTPTVTLTLTLSVRGGDETGRSCCEGI